MRLIEVHGFPRLISRGPIEAEWFTFAPHQRGLFPRLISRGPIEALRSVLTGGAQVCFRG